MSTRGKTNLFGSAHPALLAAIRGDALVVKDLLATSYGQRESATLGEGLLAERAQPPPLLLRHPTVLGREGSSPGGG